MEKATLANDRERLNQLLAECSDEEIITADTGSFVFLKGNVKILDAIEDIKMPIYI